MIGITGGSGFIGSNFIREVKLRNLEYRNFTRLCSQDANSYAIGDIDDTSDWSTGLSGVSVLVHMASVAHGKASNNDDYYNVNYLGTLNLAIQAAAAGVTRFIFISSIGVLGNSTFKRKFTENSEPNPDSIYAKSKLDAEQALIRLSESTDMEVVIIRPSLVYGVNAPGNFGLLEKLVNLTPILPFGLVNNKRNIISVYNVVDFILLCVNHPAAANQTFLLSEPEAVSIKDITNNIAIGKGKKVIQLPIPKKLMLFVGRLFRRETTINQLVGDLEVDSSFAEKTLNWKPTYTMKEYFTVINEG